MVLSADQTQLAEPGSAHQHGLEVSERSPVPANDGSLPPGLGPLYWFSALNALSFQPVLGSAMVLYAKSLGASATVLGLLAGMMPLLVITQLPAAKFIDRVGYRAFILRGWSARVVIIFLIAAVPLTGGFLDATTRLILLLALLLVFNTLRGISSCAWLPWITELIPPAARGRHFARDQVFGNGASLLSFAMAGAVLGADAQPLQFAGVFLFAALAGAVSLPLLLRVPDPAPPKNADSGKGPVPWLAIASHPPFRRLLEVNAAWSLAFGGLTTFIVKYLKDGAGLPSDLILYFMSVSFIGGIATPWLAGPRLDRLGSKPMLGFTMGVGLVIAVGWMLAAGGAVLPGWGYALPLMVLLGLVNSLFSAANTRLAMNIVPTMGRNHFFALFMVVWQITLGLSPVLWGLVLDGIGDHESTALGLNWNRYSLFFGLVGLSFIGAFVLCRRLEENTASGVQTLVKELLVDEPRRWWSVMTGR